MPHPTRRRALLLVGAALAGAATAPRAQRRPVMRLSVLQEGVLLVDDSLVTVPLLQQKLQALKQNQGILWLYRENPTADATPAVRDALQLVRESGLPVSVSSRPDFADYIDDEGRSRPRR